MANNELYRKKNATRAVSSVIDSNAGTTPSRPADGGCGDDQASLERGQQEQRDAEKQQQVGRAQQRGDVLFDPEDLVPQQVTDPAHGGHRHPDQAQAVSQRHRLGPGAVVGASGLDQPQHPQRGGRKAGVEDRMPGGEERFRLPFKVVVRPAVQADAADHPGGQQDGDQILSVGGAGSVQGPRTAGRSDKRQGLDHDRLLGANPAFSA
jgi:hypothetical protein